MTRTNAYSTNAYKHGFCDAIMNRECNTPKNSFPLSMAYLRGYMAGKATGVNYQLKGGVL